MRGLAWVVVVLLLASAALADSVSYDDPPADSYGTPASGGDPAHFEYTMTPGSGLGPTYFFVVVYPDPDYATNADYININDPGAVGQGGDNFGQGAYTDDLGGAVGDANYNGVSGIYWTADYSLSTSSFTFSFDSPVHGVGWQSWGTNGGSQPTSGSIEGPTPEPTTLALFGGGLLSLIGCGLRRRCARRRKG